jgi:TetR/AcrR family transcriptional regulator, mexJK operon transcriptional repressor
MQTSPETQRRGRPRDGRKQDAILDAAQHLFYAHGVEGVAIETIAAEAGVSKMTIYNNIGDKIAVFEAVVMRETAVMKSALDQIDAGGATLQERLVSFGQALMQFLNRPELIAGGIMIAQEAAKHPDLANRFFNAGPGRVRNMLATVIADAQSQGQLAADDPQRAAEDLVALWRGFEPALPHAVTNPGDLIWRVDRGVRLFLRAHAAQP